MREDLLKQGDQLEALVIKAEIELRALENTVQLLKWNNTDVKKAYEKLPETSKTRAEYTSRALTSAQVKSCTKSINSKRSYERSWNKFDFDAYC